eukprot:XP_001697529.1 predicted protein [Chlamydomonas reinhardtii]
MEESSNNEVSLSIEETNKLRISLGLKPLRLDSEPSQANKERQNHEAKKQQEAAAQAQELRKKLEAAREKRLMDAKLKATKTLGAADGDDGDGDMAAWDDEDDEEGGYKADQLAGLKVRHDLGEVMEGETVIVTLADKSLLDEQGNLREGDSGDELENTLLMAAFSKPKKKKEKKERRIRARSVEPEPEGDILATLEAQAEEAGEEEQNKKRKKGHAQQHQLKRQGRRSYKEDQEIAELEQRLREGAPPRGSNPLAAQEGAGATTSYAAARTFDELPLSQYTKDSLKKYKFVTLTAVQRATLPHALAGRDVLGAAKTGSGKTLSFLIPPSKNQVDKAAARDAKELAIKKAATSEDPSAELDRLRAVQRATGSAYVVLSGKNAGLPAMAAGGGGGGGATQTKSVRDLARLSLTDPEYLAVHAEAATPTPLKLQQDTAASTRELARVLAQQGHAAEAEKHYRRALGVLDTVLGPVHAESLLTANQLALLVKDNGGDPEEAEALFKRVVAATEIAAAAGRLEDAEVLSCKALVMSEKALGPTHPVTLTCAEGLAEVLLQQGMLEDAAELYLRLIESLAETVGPDDENVQKYLSQYEELYELLALQEEARLTQVRQMSSGMWSAFELALTVLGGYGRPYTKRARAITVSNIQHLSEVTNPVPIQPCQ